MLLSPGISETLCMILIYMGYLKSYQSNCCLREEESLMNFQSNLLPPLSVLQLASVLQPTARMPFAVSCCCELASLVFAVVVVFAANVRDEIRNKMEKAIFNN